MDFRDKEFLERLMAITEENNKLLHKLWRTARWARFVRVVYWIILIGVSIGALYYLQPFIDQITNFFGANGAALHTLLDNISHNPPPR